MTPSTPDVVLLLHGFGDDPARLGAAAPLVGLDPDVTTVLTPRAPNETADGPSWFGEGTDLPGALDALDDVLDAAVAARGVDRSSVVVGGLSQGGAMALALALRGSPRPPVGGAFAISGYLLPPDEITYDFARAHAVPVLVTHGGADAVVAIQQGRSAARTLERKGLPVTFLEHEDLGHTLDPAYLDDVRAWLRALAV